MLDKGIRLIAIQFSFSNPNAIPPSVKHRKPETLEEREERKSHATGKLIIPPTENCSIAEFLGELEATGYEMVDAFYKERIDPKDPHGKRTYHMVRFLFASSEFVENLHEEFLNARGIIRTDLAEMARTALWRVRAFLNPLYKDGEEITEQCAISINLEARKPLFNPDGTPVTMWQKDEKGERVGNAPIPFQAKHHFRLYQ